MMEKYCPMRGCNCKLTWYEEGNNYLGRCSIHAQVAGVFRDRPLSFLDKLFLRLQGIEIVQSSSRSKTQ